MQSSDIKVEIHRNNNLENFPITTTTTTTTTVSTQTTTIETITKAITEEPTPEIPLDHNEKTSSDHQIYRSASTNIPIEAAFTVLNNDYGPLQYIDKPNAIVYPIRRTKQTALRIHPSGRHDDDNDDLHISGIHIETAPNPSKYRHTGVHSFAEELNRKLYRLTSRSHGHLETLRSKNSSQNASNQETLNQRPLFITTVPRGKFLPPPKEIFLIPPRPQIPKRVYTYSSHPVVYQPTYNHNLHHHPYHHQPVATRHAHEKLKNSNNFSITTTTTTITTTSTTTTTTTKYKNRNYITTLPKDKLQNPVNHNGGNSGGDETLSKIASADNEMVSSVGTTTTTTTATGIQQHANHNQTNKSMYKAIKEKNNITQNLLTDISLQQQQQQQQQQPQQQYINKQSQLNRSRRDIPPAEPYKNVMHDKRVVRGSNFSTQALLSDYDPFDRAAEARRRLQLRKKSTCPKNQRNVLGTPPPVAGRRHEVMQTDKYLEELVVKPPEFSVETQTDLFLEKPPTPPYIPAKTGIDASTEIGDGELFHFDAEAQPIIDVLVDSTIELSILEVAHEQEMAAIRERQNELLALREAELAELRRLEAEELRLQAEKQRRLRQDAIAKTLDDEMQKEVTAAKLLQGHIASILPEIIDNLEPAADATKKEKLMKALCPWLSAEMATEVGHVVDSREILTTIIKEIIKQRAEVYAGYKEEVEPPEKMDEEEHECDIVETETEPTPRLPRCPSQDIQQQQQ